MPDSDKKNRPSAPQPILSFEASYRTKAGLQLRESITDIVAALQLGLARLRDMEDERSTEIAAECQDALDQIIRQIDALIEDKPE
jgi:hypothetical protein